MTPPRPDRNTWRKLMAPALRVVDSLEANGYGKLDFRLGGGTVLMFRFDHRISKDIDIFTHDAQALSFLSPRLNATAEREALDYSEQANVVRLDLADGSIDFIVAAPVLPGAPCATCEFEGRSIPLDATAEILAKKLLYRADSLKARDVFDMATVLAMDRPSAMAALHATARTRPALASRIHAMRAVPHHVLMDGIDFTPAGLAHAADMVDVVAHAVAQLDRS